MELNDEDYEEMLTIAEQCKVMLPKLPYNNELVKNIWECIKDKKQLDREWIQKAHNNYLATCLIGLNYTDSKTFKKLENYMDNEY